MLELESSHQPQVSSPSPEQIAARIPTQSLPPIIPPQQPDGLPLPTPAQCNNNGGDNLNQQQAKDPGVHRCVNFNNNDGGDNNNQTTGGAVIDAAASNRNPNDALPTSCDAGHVHPDVPLSFPPHQKDTENQYCATVEQSELKLLSFQDTPPFTTTRDTLVASGAVNPNDLDASEIDDAEIVDGGEETDEHSLLPGSDGYDENMSEQGTNWLRVWVCVLAMLVAVVSMRNSVSDDVGGALA